jgi:hypothetical protein
MNVVMWEHCTFTMRFLDVAKFTTLTPLSLHMKHKEFVLGGLPNNSFEGTIQI